MRYGIVIRKNGIAAILGSMVITMMMMVMMMMMMMMMMMVPEKSVTLYFPICLRRPIRRLPHYFEAHNDEDEE